MSDLPGYARAQAEWESRLPPDGGPVECPECSGTGVNVEVIGDRDDTCQCCDGHGLLTADGEPHDPHQAERDAEDYADIKRDEQLTDD